MPKNNAGRKLVVQPTGGRELKPSVVAYKRERILEEAGSLFFTMGYEAATLDMLAERLRVTKPFLYTYYRNKGHILSAICDLGVKESLAALDALDGKAGTSVDRLWTALAAVANIIINRYEYITIYQREMMNSGRRRCAAHPAPAASIRSEDCQARHGLPARWIRDARRCTRDGNLDGRLAQLDSELLRTGQQAVPGSHRETSGACLHALDWSWLDRLNP